jgi:hypothetical protein
MNRLFRDAAAGRQLGGKKSKPFITAFIRDLEEQVSAGEISYSRMIEIMNETAEKFYSPDAGQSGGGEKPHVEKMSENRHEQSPINTVTNNKLYNLFAKVWNKELMPDDAAVHAMRLYTAKIQEQEKQIEALNKSAKSVIEGHEKTITALQKWLAESYSIEEIKEAFDKSSGIHVPPYNTVSKEKIFTNLKNKKEGKG